MSFVAEIAILNVRVESFSGISNIKSPYAAVYWGIYRHNIRNENKRNPIHSYPYVFQIIPYFSCIEEKTRNLKMTN